MAGTRPGPAPALQPIHNSRSTMCRTVPHPEMSGPSSRTPAPQRDSGEPEPPGASRPGIAGLQSAHGGPCPASPAWGLRSGTGPVPVCVGTTCGCPHSRSSKITRRREARRKLLESQLSSVCVLRVSSWKRIYFFASINSEFPLRFYVFPEINTRACTHTHTLTHTLTHL